MKLLAIDAGGTELKYGIVDEQYNILNKQVIETPNDTVEDIVDSIYRIYCENKADAIVLSLPGFINSDTGMHMGGGCFHSLKNVNIKQLVIDKCGCDCYVENDGKSATIAEYYLGNLKGTTNSSVFIIGTGVGGGLIINGKLFKGLNYTAGEYSYLNVDIYNDNFEESSLAENCSTRSLLMMYEQYTQEHINGRKFFEKYFAGDENTSIVLDIFCENVAIEIMNLGILLNIEKVAIGGGISAQDILIEKIKEKLESLDLFNRYPETTIFKPEIVRCKYGNDANLLGVAYAYMNKENK